MTPWLALVVALSAPVAGALLVLALARPPGLRDLVHVVSALVSAVACAFAVAAAVSEQSVRVVLARPLPRVDLAFSIEPLGALIASVIAGLSLLHAIHTTGMVRSTEEHAPARMMSSIAFGYAAAAAAAFSSNLLSFFVAYQVLTLATFPLVAHGTGDEGRKAARSYLATLLTFSVGLFLPAMVWTYAVAGTLDFRAGGILLGRVDANGANALMVMYALGLAFAAIPPAHRWLIVSTGAPHSALVSIQATAILPIGVVGLLKILWYVFGAALPLASLATTGLVVLAGAGMCVAALSALSKQDLRERFAYSCLTQGLAAVMGALLSIAQGAYASTLQVMALACGAATLMMAAGNVFAATGRVNVVDTPGLGRVMPWTFAGFALGAASMIGLPPFAGAWAKLWLITAASDAQLIWAAVLVGAAAALTFAHLGPLAANALVARAPTDPFKRPDGASLLLVAPVILSAGATLWLLLLADPLVKFLGPLWNPPS